MYVWSVLLFLRAREISTPEIPDELLRDSMRRYHLDRLLGRVTLRPNLFRVYLRIDEGRNCFLIDAEDRMAEILRESRSKVDLNAKTRLGCRGGSGRHSGISDD